MMVFMFSLNQVLMFREAILKSDEKSILISMNNDQ